MPATGILIKKPILQSQLIILKIDNFVKSQDYRISIS